MMSTSGLGRDNILAPELRLQLFSCDFRAVNVI
jgi:hypothetical protein